MIADGLASRRRQPFVQSHGECVHMRSVTLEQAGIDEACSHSLGWLQRIKDPVFLQAHTINKKSLILACVCVGGGQNKLQCRWSLREVNIHRINVGLRKGVVIINLLW